MKHIFISFILFLILSSQSWGSDLHIEFDHLASSKGRVLYLLFQDESGFPDQVSLSVRQGAIAAHTAQEVGLTLSGLRDGTYALSIFHDENENGKLDTNFLGIPKEAFAFSKNPKVFFGPPSFKDASFILIKQQSLKIKFVHF